MGLVHPNTMVNDLNDAVEEAVALSFKLKRTKAPGNKIPRDIREAMKRKDSLSKQYKVTKCWRKLISIQKEIKELDLKLKDSYTATRDK